MLRLLDLPNAVSLAGLWSALAAAMLALEGRASGAFVALVLAGLCDLFDGVLARRARRDERARAFGERLDSLVDACAFGLAPAVVLYALGLRSPWEVAAVAALPAAAVWRLAWFDTTGLSVEGDTRYYTGMPVTYVALLVPVAGLAGRADPALLRPALAGATALAAVLMVSPLRFRKPHGPWYGALVALAACVVAAHLR